MFFVLMSVFTLRSKFKWNIRKQSYIYEDRINCEFCGWRTSCVCTRNTKDKSTYRWALALSPHTHTHTRRYTLTYCAQGRAMLLYQRALNYIQNSIFVRWIQCIHTHTRTQLRLIVLGKCFRLAHKCFRIRHITCVRACYSAHVNNMQTTLCVCVSLMIV